MEKNFVSVPAKLEIKQGDEVQEIKVQSYRVTSAADAMELLVKLTSESKDRIWKKIKRGLYVCMERRGDGEAVPQFAITIEGQYNGN